MTTTTENQKEYATSLAFDMLRGEDFHGLTAKQAAFLHSVVGRAYPNSRGESTINDHPTYKTLRWNDGVSQWSLNWWSRSGGGGQLVNETLSSARDSVRRLTELRATTLDILRQATMIAKDTTLKGTRVIDRVSGFSEVSRHEPSLRRQILRAESRLAAVEA
jgi:hypothetical protein